MSTFLGKKTKAGEYSGKYYRKRKFDTPYPETELIGETYVHSDIKAKLLKNEMGKFIDFRRYYQDRPTSKGIRMPIKPFLDCVDRLSKSMKELVEDDK